MRPTICGLHLKSTTIENAGATLHVPPCETDQACFNFTSITPFTLQTRLIEFHCVDGVDQEAGRGTGAHRAASSQVPWAGLARAGATTSPPLPCLSWNLMHTSLMFTTVKVAGICAPACGIAAARGCGGRRPKRRSCRPPWATVAECWTKPMTPASQSWTPCPASVTASRYEPPCHCKAFHSGWRMCTCFHLPFRAFFSFVELHAGK